VQLGYQFQNSDYFSGPLHPKQLLGQRTKATATQPLLREFGYEVNWARIHGARQRSARPSLLDYRKALEDNTEELEKDYWQLYEAQPSCKSARKCCCTLASWRTCLWNQFTFGGKATILSSRRRHVGQRSRSGRCSVARARVADISDDIKRRMSDPESRSPGPLEIRPADVPIDMPIKFDDQDQIETAFANVLNWGSSSFA